MMIHSYKNKVLITEELEKDDISSKKIGQQSDSLSSDQDHPINRSDNVIQKDVFNIGVPFLDTKQLGTVKFQYIKLSLCRAS